jgi:hypothetical protein
MIERSIDVSRGSQVGHVPLDLLSPVALANREASPVVVLSVPCACGHTAERHDAHASRYCRATVSNELQRRCICVDPTAEPVGRR